MHKNERTDVSSFLYLILFGLGIIWLVAGVCLAFSPRIAPKMTQWNYILAWIILFGLPVFAIFKYSLKGIRIQHKRLEEKTVDNVAKESILQSMVGAKRVDAQRKVDITYVENVYTIQPKTEDIKRIKENFYKNFHEVTREFSITYRCRHCNSIISQSEYESYGGLCHGCYIDFKRDLRRSGLLGADRASTW